MSFWNKDIDDTLNNLEVRTKMLENQQKELQDAILRHAENEERLFEKFSNRLDQIIDRLNKSQDNYESKISKAMDNLSNSISKSYITYPALQSNNDKIIEKVTECVKTKIGSFKNQLYFMFTGFSACLIIMAWIYEEFLIVR